MHLISVEQQNDMMQLLSDPHQLHSVAHWLHKPLVLLCYLLQRAWLHTLSVLHSNITTVSMERSRNSKYPGCSFSLERTQNYPEPQGLPATLPLLSPCEGAWGECVCVCVCVCVHVHVWARACACVCVQVCWECICVSVHAGVYRQARLSKHLLFLIT